MVQYIPAEITETPDDQKLLLIKGSFLNKIINCDQLFATLVQLLESKNHEVVLEALYFIKVIIVMAFEVINNDAKTAERVFTKVILDSDLLAILQTNVFER